MNFHAYETSKLNGKNRIAAIHRLAATKQYPFAQHYVVSLWDHLRVAPPSRSTTLGGGWWVVGGGILSFPHTRVIPAKAGIQISQSVVLLIITQDHYLLDTISYLTGSSCWAFNNLRVCACNDSLTETIPWDMVGD